MSTLEIVLYSYKNKNLARVISSAIAATSIDVKVSVIEQHPIQHKEQIESLGNVSYTHQFWDWQESPINHKFDLAGKSDADYLLIITDDTILIDGWDVDILGFLDKTPGAIVSGSGDFSINGIKDKYFINPVWTPKERFSKSGYIDRMFIAGRKEDILSIDFPIYVKYYGEEEMLSVLYSESGISIYSAPSGIFSDLEVRTLENLYTPFSIEHNYNSVVEFFNGEGADWCKLFAFDPEPLKKIPYQIDDVLYNPNDLQFVKIEQERFIDNVNGIY